MKKRFKKLMAVALSSAIALNSFAPSLAEEAVSVAETDIQAVEAVEEPDAMEAPAEEPEAAVEETQAPATEAVTEVPVTEAPATEAPVTEAPVPETPAPEVPEEVTEVTNTPPLAEPETQVTEGALEEETTPMPDTEPATEEKEEAKAQEGAPGTDIPEGADDAEGWTDSPAGTEDAAEGSDAPSVKEVPDTQETEPPAYWLTAEAGGMSFTLSAMDGSAFPDGTVLEVQDTAQFCQEAGFDAEQQEALGLLGLSQIWEEYASEAGIPGEEMPENFADALLAQDGFWVSLTDAGGDALGGTYVLEAETQDAETYRLVKPGAVVEAIPFDGDWDTMPAPEEGFAAGIEDGSLCVYWEGFRPCYFQLAILDPEWQMPEAETETLEEATEAPDGELNTEPGAEAEAETETGTEPETETEIETEARTEEGAEAEPEDMGNPYEGSMALAELAGLDDETAGAATEWAPPQAGMRRMMARALSDWSFDAYYVNQEDSSHVDKTDDFSLKYQFEFHNSRDLEAFTVSIRIPETLYADRFGKGLVPSDIGVPQGRPEEGGYTKTVSSPFNYYREDGDLVFFNYRQMRSGTNAAVQVLYKNIQALDTIDGSTWSLQPEASVTGEDGVETRQAGPLTGYVDTKAELSSILKEAKKVAGKSYTPGLYTRAQVESYLSPGGLPEKYSTGFGQYAYVLWELGTTGSTTQAWDLYLDGDARYTYGGVERAGETVGVTAFVLDRAGQTVKTVALEKETSGAYAGQWKAPSYLSAFRGRKDIRLKYYAVCAYPKEYVKNNSTVFTNHATATLHPSDGLDADQVKEAEAKWTWVDYKWTYSGDIIGVKKYTERYPYKDRQFPAWMDAYLQASAAGTDLGSFPFRVEGYCKGYSYTHSISGTSVGDYVPGSYYEVTTVDDALYAYPLDGELAGQKRMLTDEDYYFSDVVIRQKDTGYDVFEDAVSKVEPEGSTEGIDRGLTVYAMYAGSSTWEEVSYVPWDGKGDLYYHFTQEQITRRPWRVKAVHNAVDHTSECFMDLKVSVRADSPAFASFVESGAGQVKVENLDGIMGKRFTKTNTTGSWFHDQSTTGGTNYSEEGLAELTKDLYGVICMRDAAFVTLDGLGKHAQAQKYAKAYNDPKNGRIGLEYTVSAYEGYQLYGKEAIPYLEQAGVPLPHRAGMVFYDLLPYGVQFDPSVPVTAGRLTGCTEADLEKPSRWDAAQVSVTVDPGRDVLPDWRDTGRTLVAFHVSYGGADPSVCAARQDAWNWMDGYGVSFGAYCSWADAKAAEQTPNVCAVLPEAGDTEPYLAREDEACQDNGSGTGDYAVFGADLNGDGITEARHVLYAKAKAFEEIAIATQSGIEKSVRADSDRFGEFTRQAAVGTGDGYTYGLTVTNASRYPLHDIVVFDRLENAAKDRAGTEETMPFEDAWWAGTLRRVDTSAAEELGIQPVVYYNAGRDAALPQGSQDPAEVLTAENGWVLASAWAKPVSEVKALAVDLRLTEGGEAFQLGNMESVTFRICMDAPPAMPEAKYAYNNPSFFSITDGLTPDDTVAHTVVGNSVRVKLEERTGVEVVKRLAGEHAEEFLEESFAFRAYTMADGEEIPYASREYALYKKNGDTWELVDALCATDAEGRFFLRADEKAVFREAADAGNLVIREAEDPRFRTDASEEAGGGLRTITFTNEPRPVVYLTKHVTAVPEGMDLADTTFRVQVKTDGAPLAGSTYWVVKQAEPYGTLPEKLGEGVTDGDGNLTIHAGETLALFPGSFGTDYTITEQPDSYGDGTDWICRRPEVSGVADTYVKNAQIENIYKWRGLYLTKELTHQGPEDCSEAFSFRFWELGDGASFDPENPEATARLLTGLSWELLDPDRKPLEEPVTGTTGEDGVLSCMCAGKVIRISGLEAGKTIVAQEVDIPEHYAAVNEGIAEVQMPVYAPSANIKLTNDCLLRDLKVSKLVVPEADGDIPDTESKTATSPNWPNNYPANMTEAANFQEFTFDGASAVTVTFDPTCKTESATYDWVCLYDRAGTNVSGKLGGTAFAGKAYTIPGDYVKIAMRSDSSVQYKGYSCTVTPISEMVTDDNITKPFEMKLSIKGKGSFQPGSGIPYVVERGGENIREGVTGEDGSFTIRGSETAVFRYLGKAGLEYQVMETPDADCPPVYPAEGEAAEGSLDKDGGKVVMINGSQGNLVIRKEYTAKDGDKAGEYLADGSLLGKGLLEASFTVETLQGGWSVLDTDVILADSATGNMRRTHTGEGNPFTMRDNEVAVIRGLAPGVQYRVREAGDSQHRMVYDEVHGAWLWFDQAEPAQDGAFEGSVGTDNAVIVNQVRSFQVGSRIYKKMAKGSAAVPAGAELVLRVERYDGVSWNPASGVRYLTAASDSVLESGDVQVTGSDGLVRLYKRSDGVIPSVHFASAVKLNLKEGMKAGDLRAVEVPELSHPSYGYLLGYSSTDYYFTASQDIADMGLSPDFANIFINSNVLKEVEIEKAMDGEDPHDFTMILTGGSIGTGEDAPAAGLPYTVYGSETNGLVREGVTTKNGEFTLKAGQYAKFLLPDGSSWNVREAASYPYSLKEAEGAGENLEVRADGSVHVGLVPKAVDGSLTREMVTFGVYDPVTGEKVNLTEGDVVIPEVMYYQGRVIRLTEIAKTAFLYCVGLESVVAPSSVTSIGDDAFRNCSNLAAINIPDGITSIRDYAFSGCSSLAAINIPDSVTSIGSDAFAGCSSLTSVNIPESVTTIGFSAFEKCSNLTSINIPDSVMSIRSSAFAYCSSLESITIPDSVTSIGSDAFSGCSNLAEINIPDSVTRIEASTFSDCSSLTSITIPDGVTSIGNSAFYGCSSLAAINLPEGVTSIGKQAFWDCSNLAAVNIPDGITNIENQTFCNCSNLTIVNIPDGVTSIGVSAFNGCSSLVSIDLPDSVTSIGSYAFYGCKSLETIAIPEKITKIWNQTFANCSKLYRVDIPASVESILYDSFQNTAAIIYIDKPKESIGGSPWGFSSIVIWKDGWPDDYKDKGYLEDENFYYENNGSNLSVVGVKDKMIKKAVIPNAVDGFPVTGVEGAFRHCLELEYVEIPDGVASIGREAFYKCPNLTNIVMPDSIISIGNSAFLGCSGLTNFVIPDGVEVIDFNAFNNCSNLTSIDIPDSVQSIGDQAFSGCSSLTSIDIPDGVWYIKDTTFSGCSSLASIDIPDSVTIIGDYAFSRCSSLASIDIPDSVTIIGDYAFSRCSSLASIDIPDSVTFIGDYAFSGCSGLAEINIPDSVTSISNYTFNGCSNLAEINIPDSVTSIGRYAFSGCSGLAKINIPEGVTSIEDSVFSGCSRLAEINIPGSVTSIGDSAFDCCSSLAEINIPGSVTSIGDSAFYGCSNLATIKLPDSVTSIGSYAFDDCSSLENITIPDGVTSIGDSTFSGCSSLENITIPDGVTSIGDSTFSGCSSLENITIPDGVTSIGDSTFSGCSSLENITIPDGVMSIGNQAFSSCYSLKEVIIPNSMQSIYSSAFQSCSSLSSMIIKKEKDSIPGAPWNSIAEERSLLLKITWLGEN